MHSVCSSEGSRVALHWCVERLSMCVCLSHIHRKFTDSVSVQIFKKSFCILSCLNGLIELE